MSEIEIHWFFLFICRLLSYVESIDDEKVSWGQSASIVMRRKRKNEKRLNGINNYSVWTVELFGYRKLYGPTVHFLVINKINEIYLRAKWQKVH